MVLRPEEVKKRELGSKGGEGFKAGVRVRMLQGRLRVGVRRGVKRGGGVF